MGIIYVVVTGLIFIFQNLSNTKSAISGYSIFNKGHKKLLGEVDLSQFGINNNSKN